MADHTNSWNNATPADTGKVGLGDENINEIKSDISERMEIDHIFNSSITEDSGQDGVHKKLTMKNDNTVSSGVADAGILHVKDAAGKAELFYMDENDNDIQITSVGKVASDLSGFTEISGYCNVLLYTDVGLSTVDYYYGMAYPSGYNQNNMVILTAHYSDNPATNGWTAMFPTTTAGPYLGSNGIVLWNLNFGTSHTFRLLVYRYA